MTIEQQIRQHVERIYQDLNVASAVDTAEIRAAALAQFTKELDGKLANLQEGESLQILYRVDIMTAEGRVRGGSGAQRNMPEYIEWRAAVYARDGYTCQECGATRDLNAHHVKHWAHHPALRFDVSNGLTLCAPCHRMKHPHLGLNNGTTEQA